MITDTQLNRAILAGGYASLAVIFTSIFIAGNEDDKVNSPAVENFCAPIEEQTTKAFKEKPLDTIKNFKANGGVVFKSATVNGLKSTYNSFFNGSGHLRNNQGFKELQSTLEQSLENKPLSISLTAKFTKKVPEELIKPLWDIKKLEHECEFKLKHSITYELKPLE